MDKKRIEIIITSGLAVVLIFVWIGSFKKIVAKRKQNQPAVKQTIGLVQTESKGDAASKPFVDRQENLSWVRCPFSGKIYRSAVKEDQELKLEGVNWDTASPMAVINGLILTVGDEINGKTIIDIREDRVILNDGTKDLELLLNY